MIVYGGETCRVPGGVTVASTTLLAMLPKSRILSALLVGLGLALVVGSLLAPRFLLGDGRLPLDLERTTWTLHDESGTREGEQAPVTRQLHMEVQDPANDDVASVRIGDTLRAGTAERDFDNLVAASTWSMLMDRVTGQVALPAQVAFVMGMPPTEVPVDAPWLKLPSDVQPRDYAIFDPQLRGGAPAQFTGEEEIAGRTVYTFNQHIEPTNLALRYADPFNTSSTQVGEESVRTFRHYAAEREYQVDQVSGLVVGMREKVDVFYADKEGAHPTNVITYDAAMDPADTEAMVQQLSRVYSQATSQKVTWAVLALGVLIALLGLIGAFRPARGR